MNDQSGNFFFRIWLLQEDPPQIETWSHELDPMRVNARSVGEWANEHLTELDLYDKFGLDREKDWQVVGRGTIRGTYSDWCGEWDDESELTIDEKSEVPESYIKLMFGSNPLSTEATDGDA